MALDPGSKIGVYEVLSAIGAGGMGEVYRARDTKLDRDVAIKVLPEELSTDAERVARFEREAKLLASLNHPNIAGIYGFETEGDVNAIVLELIEGAHPRRARRAGAHSGGRGDCHREADSRRRSRPDTRQESSTATSSPPTSR